MCTNNKIHKTFCVAIGGEIYSDMDKILEI